MTDPDQLPAPFPPNESGSTPCIVRWMVTLKGGLWLGAYDKEAFDSYALTAIATERARTDALQAELDAEKETTANLVRALREATEGPTFMGEPVLPPIYARADALEAALREVLLAQENYARCHAREVNAINNYSGGQAEYSSATLKATVRVSEAERAARALLEKKT